MFLSCLIIFFTQNNLLHLRHIQELFRATLLYVRGLSGTPHFKHISSISFCLLATFFHRFQTRWDTWNPHHNRGPFGVSPVSGMRIGSFIIIISTSFAFSQPPPVLPGFQFQSLPYQITVKDSTNIQARSFWMETSSEGVITCSWVKASSPRNTHVGIHLGIISISLRSSVFNECLMMITPSTSRASLWVAPRLLL